jgi:hypothetical protein
MLALRLERNSHGEFKEYIGRLKLIRMLIVGVEDLSYLKTHIARRVMIEGLPNGKNCTVKNQIRVMKIWLRQIHLQKRENLVRPQGRAVKKVPMTYLRGHKVSACFQAKLLERQLIG